MAFAWEKSTRSSVRGSLSGRKSLLVVAHNVIADNCIVVHMVTRSILEFCHSFDPFRAIPRP